MELSTILNQDFSAELSFLTSRSSGPGGQNVNKVESKVELRFDVKASQLFTDAQKDLIIKGLGRYINHDGLLCITAQTHRSQLQNKQHTIRRFKELIVKALTPKPKRVPTKPSATAVAERLKNKKAASEKKAARQKPVIE